MKIPFTKFVGFTYVLAIVILICMLLSYEFNQTTPQVRIELVKHHTQVITVDQKLNSIENYLKQQAK